MAALDRSMWADLPLLTTKPTTLAGVVALLEYVDTPRTYESEEQTILDYAREWSDERLSTAAEAFHANITVALRELA
jgi:hypothetical protein